MSSPAGHLFWEPRDRSLAAIVTITDVTELKETQRELEGEVKIRNEFLSIASHELRTPLTSLQLQLESLHLSVTRDCESTANVRLADKLKAAIRQAQRLDKLTEALLDVSRMTTAASSSFSRSSI